MNIFDNILNEGIIALALLWIMTHYRSITNFYNEQERILLEPVAGQQLASVRIIINTLKQCTTSANTVQQTDGSVVTPLTITITESARLAIVQSASRLLDTHPHVFDQLKQCAAMVRDTVMQIFMQSEPSVVTAATQTNIPSVTITFEPTAQDYRKLHDPLSTLAPLDSPPTEALQCATDLVSETFAASGSGRADIAALCTTLDAQALLHSETQDKCIEAFEVLARDFPELMPEIHKLYRSLIDTATTLFTTLRASALQPASHEEFVRYLAVLHSAMSDALSDFDMMSGAAGLKQHFAELLMTSVTQSLAMARVLHAKDAESYCTMLPEATPIEHMRPKEKKRQKARYEKANQSWHLCFTQWRQSLERMTAAGQDSSQIRTCTHMMNGVFSSVDWLYSYYRATDATVIHPANTTTEPSLDRSESPDCVPQFSAVIAFRSLLDTPNDDSPLPVDEEILRHLTYTPGSLPALTVHHKNGTSKRIVECWMCLPDGPISSPQNVIPFTTICDDLHVEHMRRFSQFATSIRNSGRTERENLHNNPLLTPKFPAVHASRGSLYVYHDSKVYAVAAPLSLATGPFSEEVLLNPDATKIMERIMSAFQTKPNFINPEEPPTLIHLEVFDTTKAPNEEHLDRKRVSTFFHTRTVWPINMLTPIFEAAGITIVKKKGIHWKLISNGKIYPIPSEAISDREWNNTTVINALLTIGNVERFLAWVDEQQRPCASTRISS